MLAQRISYQQLKSQTLTQQLLSFEYSLLMDNARTQHQSLTHKLCYMNDTGDLLNEHINHNNPELLSISIHAQCPHIYIQKMRAIYYLLLLLVYDKKQQKYVNVFKKIRYLFYQSSEVDDVKKKYLIEFINFINYNSGSRVIKETINKYQIIDQILIDTLISQIKAISDSPDDNYAISQWLTKLQLSNEIVTYYQLNIEEYSIRVSDKQIHIQEITQQHHTQHDEHDLDESNVFSVEQDIFERMDKSYINSLLQSQPQPIIQQQVVQHNSHLLQYLDIFNQDKSKTTISSKQSLFNPNHNTKSNTNTNSNVHIPNLNLNMNVNRNCQINEPKISAAQKDINQILKTIKNKLKEIQMYKPKPKRKHNNEGKRTKPLHVIPQTHQIKSPVFNKKHNISQQPKPQPQLQPQPQQKPQPQYRPQFKNPFMPSLNLQQPIMTNMMNMNSSQQMDNRRLKTYSYKELPKVVNFQYKNKAY